MDVYFNDGAKIALLEDRGYTTIEPLLGEYAGCKLSIPNDKTYNDIPKNKLSDYLLDIVFEREYGDD